MTEIYYNSPVFGLENEQLKKDSGFGYRTHPTLGTIKFHAGIDYQIAQGTEIFSAAEGQVLRIGTDHSEYGNFIVVKHPNGEATLYAHLSAINVIKDQYIGTDYPIGLSGGLQELLEQEEVVVHIYILKLLKRSMLVKLIQQQVAVD